MNRLENKVFLTVDHPRLAACIAAPKHVDKMVALRSERLDGRIGKGLPAYLGVAVGLMCANGERGVEEQYALTCPTNETAIRRNGLS